MRIQYVRTNEKEKQKLCVTYTKYVSWFFFFNLSICLAEKEKSNSRLEPTRLKFINIYICVGRRFFA